MDKINKTTYLVSGYMRSGTSMMMRALEAGGLEAAFNPNRNEMNERFGDEYYKPNGPGFYELTQQDYQAPNFPLQYEGKLVKCLIGGITRIIPGNYKIVFMRRDVEEIRQSYDAFFNPRITHDVEEVEQRIENTIGIMKQRQDCDVIQVWYRDVVSNTQNNFNSLKHAGWPIDVEKSCSVVDEKLCRFKREDLEIGI